MKNEFKNQLFNEIAEQGNYTKEQVSKLFSFAESVPSLVSGFNFIETYIKATKLDDDFFDRFSSEIKEHGGNHIDVINYLSGNYYDLTNKADLYSLIDDHILIGDEENTADYFNGMMINDPFKQYLLYESHFGKNATYVSRFGTIVFDDDELFNLNKFDFWTETLPLFEKYQTALN